MFSLERFVGEKLPPGDTVPMSDTETVKKAWKSQIQTVSIKDQVHMLTNWFLRNDGDETEICFYKCLLTVPLQIRTITNSFQPSQTGSLFTSALSWRACFYENRDL